MTDVMAVEFAKEIGLSVVKQTTEFINPGDVLTILQRVA
jgi:hypothetical protein